MKKLFAFIFALAIIIASLLLFWRFWPQLAKLPTGPKSPIQNALDGSPNLHIGSASIPLSSLLGGSLEDDYTKITVELENPGSGNLSLVVDLADDVLSGYADAFDPSRLSLEDKQIISSSAAGKYTLDLVGKKTIGLGGRWSYRIETYSYTGGAHGSFVVTTRSYDQDKNQISLSEVTGLSNPLASLSSLVKPRLLEAVISKTEGQGIDEYKPGEDFDGGTAPTPENYSTWYLEGSDLVIVFNQYQIGSYALGEYEIGVPLDSIR